MPQFDAGVFRSTMKRWVLELSNFTPHFSQSNGNVKAAQNVNEKPKTK
jgi:hypothetical protein